MILNRKENFCIVFATKTKKKIGFCDDCDNYIHCKKVKYIRERLDNAYYFSLRRDSPWQPTHWKVFLYYEIDKKFQKYPKTCFRRF